MREQSSLAGCKLPFGELTGDGSSKLLPSRRKASAPELCLICVFRHGAAASTIHEAARAGLSASRGNHCLQYVEVRGCGSTVEVNFNAESATISKRGRFSRGFLMGNTAIPASSRGIYSRLLDIVTAYRQTKPKAGK